MKSSELSKLQLAERTNEIYRAQRTFLSNMLVSLRALVQDKENIIENMVLRCDVGITKQDSDHQGGNQDLMHKAEALEQQTILENDELSELLDKMRNVNFHLRNEIYELVGCSFSVILPLYALSTDLHFVARQAQKTGEEANAVTRQAA